MKAMLLTGYEGPASFQAGEIDRRTTGTGEVSIRPRFSALNHLDVWISRGLPKRDLPHIAGADAAGVVTAIGDGVDHVSVGDEVVIDPSMSCGACALCEDGEIVYCAEFGILGEHHRGVFGEEVVVPAVNVLHRPQKLSWEQSSAYQVTYVTAWRMLRRAGMEAGCDLLVVGAGSGVSTACIAIGAGSGARVIATSRSAEKREAALALGAHAVFDTDGFAAAVRAETRGRGADITVDHVGPATLKDSLSATAPGGTVAICGGTSGPAYELNLPRLFFRQHRILGSTMGNHDDFAEITEMLADGIVTPPPIDSVRPLSELAAAAAHLDGGAQFGKVVLDHEGFG